VKEVALMGAIQQSGTSPGYPEVIVTVNAGDDDLRFVGLDELERVEVTLTPTDTGGGSILPGALPPVASYRGGSILPAVDEPQGYYEWVADTHCRREPPRLHDVTRSPNSQSRFITLHHARSRERRSCSTRRAKSASSSSSGSSDLGDPDPPGALWRFREILAAEIRRRLFHGCAAVA
jgi:hypothetical protein